MLSSAPQAIIVGEECARAKPHPDPYLDGAKALGLGLDEVFAVEDSPSGAPPAACCALPFATHLKMASGVITAERDLIQCCTLLQATRLPAGIQAAVAGDIPVIALTVGHPRAKLEAAKATHVLDNWFELAELVKSTQA